MAVEFVVNDGVATVTINRPERKNAITMAMRSEFQAVFQVLADDDDVRVIILTGAGGDFAAGARMSRGVTEVRKGDRRRRRR